VPGATDGLTSSQKNRVHTLQSRPGADKSQRKGGKREEVG